MKRARAALVFGLVLIGCRSFWPPTPSESRIKSDLVGQKLAYAHQLLSTSVWTIEPDEIKGWRLMRRATDRKAGTDVVYAAVRLENGTQAISGTVKITYRLFDQGWQLEKVAADSEFAVLERSQASR